jgi:hypothetical protein
MSAVTPPAVPALSTTPAPMATPTPPDVRAVEPLPSEQPETSAEAEPSPFDFAEASGSAEVESQAGVADDYSMMPTADDLARHVAEVGPDVAEEELEASRPPDFAPPTSEDHRPPDASLADVERLDSGFVEPGQETARPYVDAQAYAAEDYGADQYYGDEGEADSFAATPVVNAAITPRLSIGIPSAAAARGADTTDEFREAPDTEWPPRREVLAAALDSIAQKIRSGELVVPAFETGMSDPAMLTAVLASVLGVRR